jgi:hypothetical protein
MSGPVQIREQPIPATVPDPLKTWLAQFQGAAWTAIRALASMRITQGAHLQGLELAIGANTVSHQLGRMPRGWMLTRQGVVLGLYETDAQVGQRDTRFLYLTATAAGTADLWVF